MTPLPSRCFPPLRPGAGTQRPFWRDRRSGLGYGMVTVRPHSGLGLPQASYQVVKSESVRVMERSGCLSPSVSVGMQHYHGPRRNVIRPLPVAERWIVRLEPVEAKRVAAQQAFAVGLFVAAIAYVDSASPAILAEVHPAARHVYPFARAKSQQAITGGGIARVRLIHRGGSSRLIRRVGSSASG